MKRILLGALILLSSVSAATAEELKDILARVQQLAEQKKFKKALEELVWAQKDLEKQHSTGVKAFFPDDLAGYKGAPATSQNMLGISNFERRYSKDGGASVTVSLTGTAGGPGGAMNPLAAFGQMAVMMGGDSGEGKETFRLNGRTATLESDPDTKSAEMTVILESGSLLKFELRDSGKPADDVKAFANGIKIEDLDAYLKG